MSSNHRLKALALLLSFSVWGCGPSPERIERERVLRAIDALRDAPSRELPARRLLLAELEHQPATVVTLRYARDTCVTAYRLLLDGTELQEKVRAELAGGDPSSSLVARLLDAEAKIQKSATLMPDCERAVAELRLPGKR